MDVGSWAMVMRECTLDRVSTFVFLKLGRYAIMNWNLLKKRAQCTRWGFNLLADLRYSKFL